MLYIGIDPGKNGALCIINGNDLEFHDFDLGEYIMVLKSAQIDDEIRAGIELVHAMPKQGVSSCFSFGQRLGELEGVLQTLKIPYELIPPRVWQKSCGVQPKADKKQIAAVLTKLYPKANLLGKQKGLKDGRSDALGIAHFLRLKYK